MVRKFNSSYLNLVEYLRLSRWRRSLLTLVLLTTAVISGTPALAGPECAKAVESVLRSLEDKDYAGARPALIAMLQREGAPAYLKRVGNSEIPVILVTKNTAPKIQEFLDNSFGTQIALQPGYNNDHGMMRLTDRIIDVDLPGARGFGEIHQTGIAWKPLGSYLERRQAGSGVLLEVSYALKPDEKLDAELYQRVRRAAIIRANFTFGGTGARNDLPNMMASGGEHCFIFCKGSAINTQESEIRSRIQKLGVADVNSLLNDPRTQRFLSLTREHILAVDPNNKNLLNNSTVTGTQFLEVLGGAVPEHLNKQEKMTLANWIVGLDATQRYRALLGNLGVTSDMAIADAHSKRATAILVYDSDQKSADFRSGKYTSDGKFYNLRSGDQRPLPPIEAHADPAAATAPAVQEPRVQFDAPIAQPVRDAAKAAPLRKALVVNAQTKPRNPAAAASAPDPDLDVDRATKKNWFMRLFD